MKLKRKLKSMLAILFISFGALMTTMSPVAAQGKNQYYLSFLYNPDTKAFGAFVVQNSGRTRMEASYSKLNTRDSLLTLVQEVKNFNLYVTAKDKMLGLNFDNENVSSQMLEYYPFTFPEFGDVDGQMMDYNMATNVGSELTRALNSTTSHILKPVSSSGRKELGLDIAVNFFKLSVEIANSGKDVIASSNSNFVDYSYGKLKWSIRQARESDMGAIKNIPMGLTFKDYVVVANNDDKNIVVPYLYPKGYSPGQEYFGQQITQATTEEITPKLSWGHVVYLANEHRLIGGTVQNPGTINKDDAFSKIVSALLNSLITFFTSMLGLHTVEELMFNAGTRGATHYFGIMPMSWLQPINILNLVATVISLVVIGISIVRMLIRRNIATITPSVKADLMEGVKDMFIVSVGIVLFMPFLYIILNFNETIVVALRNLSPSGTVLGLTKGAGGWGLGEAIMQIAYIFILIMLNITYLIRSVTLALLIGFAPFFISMFGAGGAAKKISATWLKELISNIFMQTFNAAMLLVFTNIGAYGSLSLIERFALLISFIPLTKFFKAGLMNLGSGSDAIGEKTAGTFTNLATAMAAGALVSRFDGKTEKDGKAVSQQGKGHEGSSHSFGQAASAGSGAGASSNKRSLKGGLGEVGRIVGKGAAMAAGAGISLGSASTGGSPVVGNAVMFAGAQSIGNQVEGWMHLDDEEPSTVQGSELNPMGVSGFDNDKVMFTPETRKSVNSNKEQFMESVNTYNEHSEVGNMEPLYSDRGDQIVGVRIPGVEGKTVTTRDPETGKTMFSESTYTGRKHLVGAQQTWAGLQGQKQAPEKESQQDTNKD